MKLYRIEYGVTDEANRDLVCVQWAGTQAEAKKIERELMDGDAYDIDCETIDVPTDKPGLLEWLNQHMSGDLAE